MKRHYTQRKFSFATVVLIAASVTLTNVSAGNDRLANIPKSEYSARRQKLTDQIKDGVVAMIGAREEDLGEVGRFRQHNDFMYLTGVQTPDSYLIIVPAGVIPGKPRHDTVFIPPRNIMHEQ